MAQIKKPEIRSAIVAAAEDLFRERGYAFSTISQIAKRAKVSPANIYVYFGSKLDVLFAVYDPWLRARIDRMAERARHIEKSDDRLRFVLRTLWNDIPGDDNCFANNLIQALAGVSQEDIYSRDLLLWAERQVGEILVETLPPERRFLAEGGGLVRLIFMAFDGFAVNHNLNGPTARIDTIVEVTAAMLTGAPGDTGKGGLSANEGSAAQVSLDGGLKTER